MKKTGKILLIIISLALVLVALAGCGNNVENNTVDNTADNAVSNTTTNTDNQTTSGKISRGVIDENNVYRSEYADITFTLPDGWSYATDEQIAELMEIGVDALNEDDDFEEMIKENGLYDMVATNQSTGASVMVLFEKSESDLNVEYYLRSLKKGLEAVTDFNYQIEEEFGTETIEGKEYRTLTAEVPDYGMVQKYYIVKKDNYFVVVLVTYLEAYDDLDSIMAHFQ